MVKKQKMNEEALDRRSKARSMNRREALKIREAYNKEVLDLIYSQDGPVEKSFLSSKSRTNSIAVRATAYVLAERARKVLTSMGINPPLSLEVMYHRNEAKTVSAVTDFNKISIAFDMGMVDPSDPSKIADLLAALKGVVYHEGGHIMLTLPWKALFDCALMDNGLNPIAFNPYAVRHGDYFADTYAAYEDVRSTLKSIDTLIPNNDTRTILSEDSLWQKHQYHYYPVADTLHPSWNLLEDGRMEQEMVINNPPMINYFTSLVLNYMVDEKEPGYSWPFVITRLHLDEELIDNIRQLAYKFAKDKNLDVTLVDRIEEQVHVYRQSKTATDVVVAVWQMHNLITQWMAGANGGKQPRPDETGREGKGSPNPGGSQNDNRDSTGQTVVTEKPTFGDEGKGWETKPGDPDNKNPEDGEGGNSEGKPDEGESKTKDDKGKGESNDPSTDSTNTTGGFKGTGGKIKENVNYQDIREKLKQLTKEAVARIVSEHETEQLIAEINAELMRDMPHNGAVSPMTGKLIADSMAVANQMLSALEPLALTADPAWRFRQEHGVLDPTSYKMHEPGDSDYWVDYEGEGAHGHSLAVSVMLDTSGSMQGWMDQLSVAAYGIRSACDSLNIPCTVSTFDTEPYMIWDNDEVAQPLLIHDGGGTNPLDGLRQIKNQGAGKKRHLVVILTDGEWSHVKSIKPFVEPGQYWLMVGLGSEEYAKELVSRKGGDVAIGIDDVMNLPKEIEKALIGFLA